MDPQHKKMERVISKNLLQADLLSIRNINGTSKGWREITNTGRTTPSGVREEQETW